MKNLFTEADKNEIVNRINKLSPVSERLWGKMEVPQIIAHCNAALETAAGKNFPKRFFIGRLISLFTKAAFLSEKIFGKNYPTDPGYTFTGQLNFETEKGKLLSTIQDFYAGGMEKCSNHSHPFYGKLTPKEWGIAMYKHFDHHLRQFGV
jgi:hypothetical protein